MRVCVFEDDGVRWLEPVATTRPAWELLVGSTSLLSRSRARLRPDDLVLWCRPYLADVVRERYPGTPVNVPLEGEWLLANARWYRGGEELIGRSGQWAAECDGIVAMARAILQGERPCGSGSPDPIVFDTLPRAACDIDLVRYLWDLVEAAPGSLAAEASDPEMGIGAQVPEEPGVIMLGRERIGLAPGAAVRAGAVLDARSGPIRVGKNAEIGSLATIEGPAYIGPNSVVNPGSRVRGGCVFGPCVKVGGEIENTVIQGFTNKQHDGFLGHSYIGSWVNLGAGTTNSDLKNNYHPVRVPLGERLVASGRLKVGLFMGDHCTTGIGTLFNTGSVVGVGSNVYGGGLMPTRVAPFSWGTGSLMGQHRLPEFLETVRTMMKRRHEDLSPAYERMLREVYGRMVNPPVEA